MKTVYTCFSTERIHQGHLTLLEEAQKYGRVVIGALSDRAMIWQNRFPTLSLEERMKLYAELPGVDQVVVQEDVRYDAVLEELRPDYVIHCDHWEQCALRDNVVEILGRIGGELIEIPGLCNEAVEAAEQRARDVLMLPEFRRKRLRQLLDTRSTVRTIEVHSGLTGRIAETAAYEQNGRMEQFDAMWISSLCDSTAKGKPDIELVDMTSRLQTINDVLEVTTKPIIFDGDTGGYAEHFVYHVRTLERLGVSAIIIEDKIGLKKNSLFGTSVEQTQDSVENFCAKIAAGKRAQLTDEFMIIARIESLILGQGMEDALKRAFAYVKAGADGIMIHSRKKDPAEIFAFCEQFRQTDKTTPIVVVPTAFDSVVEEELAKHGSNIVIYANQLTRSAFPVMRDTAVEILRNHRAKEVDDRLLSIKDIITLIEEL